MLWFARWQGQGASEYTGWYVGRAEEVGQCRGYLMAPSVDVALCPARMPERWMVGRGPSAGYVPAPGLSCAGYHDAEEARAAEANPADDGAEGAGPSAAAAAAGSRRRGGSPAGGSGVSTRNTRSGGKKRARGA